MMKRFFSMSLVAISLMSGSIQAYAEQITLRVGHFPNITHAQGVIAHQLSRQGKGWFEQRLGADVNIEWYVYNAGPSAMEAIFANALDLTYVGPNPSINAYVKSNGEEIRILAGSTNGGAALVVQGDGRIQKPEDFRSKKIATPQLGNTQDISCRSWLIAQGYNVTQTGGDVFVLPTANPDQLALFAKGDIDGVWTVEPWVSRLELEANGKMYLEEPEAITTVLASSVKFLNDHRDLAKKFADAHAELTAWIQANPAEAQALIQAELKEETSKEISTELLTHAWPRLHFTNDITVEALQKFVASAKSVGFLREEIDFTKLIEKP